MTIPLFLSSLTVFPTTVAQPSYNSSEDHTPRVLTASFGDGYSQRSLDGINNDPGLFNLVWTNLLDAESDNIVNFLSARAGVVAFTWTPPRGSVAIAVTCKKWNKTWTDAGAQQLTAEFRQVFDIT
jgi:phage-related protein